MAGDVTYTKARERRFLRFAVWQAWGMKCYWCDTPKTYVEVEIDHIVPKGLSPTQLKQALNDYGLEHDFDLHDPKNLAPICDPCNGRGRKGPNVYARAAVVLDHLRKAAELHDDVVKTVREFRKGGDLTKALLELAAADTRTSSVRELFRSYFPAAATTAASIDPTLLDLPTYRDLHIDCGYPVRIDTAPEFARELWLLETFLDCDLEKALAEPLRGLLRALTSEMEYRLQRQSKYEPVDFGPPTPHAFDARLVEINLPPKAHIEVDVELVLRFDGGLTSSATRYADDGSERLELQGEAMVSGSALVQGTWSADDGVQLSDEVTLEQGLTIDTWFE